VGGVCRVYAAFGCSTVIKKVEVKDKAEEKVFIFS